MTSTTDDVAQKTLEQLHAELEQARAELAMERQKNARLQREIEEIRTAIAEDPSPAAAQQRADAIATGGQAAGYTPMTLHLLNGAGGGNAQGKSGGGRFWNNTKPQAPQEGRRRRGRGRHK
jgi:septal ring factor EnvC (AmiA/AmiB activator)